MDKNTRKILRGMSTAGLILAGSVPLMAKHGLMSCMPIGTCDGKSKTTKSSKAKDRKSVAEKDNKSAAKKKAEENAKKTPPAAKTKSQTAKTK